MIGRRSILTLSLLGVLAFCAFGAQNAFGAWQTATNTTAFECSPSATVLDHSDAHCDDTVSSGGTYGHKSITAGTAVDIETSNTKTKNNTTEAEEAVLKGSLLGASVTVTCKKVEPDREVTSFVKNIANGDFEGTSAVLFEECHLEGNGGEPGCHVVEPITLATLFHAVEEPVAGNMAIEFTPDGGTTFVTLHFTGSDCLLASAPVKGSARGTGSGADKTGATLKFEPADESLTFGGNAATFEGIFTTKVESTGNALVTTTNQSTSTWETASNTTVFECSASAAAKEYADAHCDKTGGTAYGHKAISPGKVVEIETSNTATKNNTTEAEPAVLKGELLGASAKIICNKIEPDNAVASWVKNVRPGDFEGTSAMNYSECTLEGNGSSSGCHVEEPITWATTFHAVERGAREMAIEFKPDPSTSTTFVTIKFGGTGCGVAEAEVKGSTRGTGSGAEASGATVKFLAADEELTFGGDPATIEGVFTTKAVATGNALVTTTTE